MSHSVVLHTKVKVSQLAEEAMEGLPRRDRRLLDHLLRRLRRNSLFKVFQIPAKSETKSAFVKGRAWLHALDSAVALFRLKGAVLELVDLLTTQTYKIVWLEFVVVREMEQKQQHMRTLKQAMGPNDRYRYRPA